MTSPLKPAYQVFTREHDELMSAPEVLAEYQQDRPDLTQQFSNFVLERLEEIKAPAQVGGDAKRPVTFLLDCSGSMRGTPISVIIPSLIRIGDMLQAQGRPFEILGFTTRSWKGGNSRIEWIATGRDPQVPGRLCDLRHIVFKSRDAEWESVRMALTLTFLDGLLKENVDGEALEWAASRAAIYHRGEENLPAPGIVLITDGPPVDDSTIAANPEEFLNTHLVQVKAAIRQQMPLSVVAIKGGDDQIAQHPEAVQTAPHIEHIGDRPEDRVTNAIAQAIEKLEDWTPAS